MTLKSKNSLTNINLFVLVVALGLFMYWHKHIHRNPDTQQKQAEVYSTFHQNLTQVFFDK